MVVDVFEMSEKLDAVHLRHVQVGQDELDLLGGIAQNGDRMIAILDRGHSGTFLANEIPLQNGPHERIIIGNKHMRSRFHCTTRSAWIVQRKKDSRPQAGTL